MTRESQADASGAAPVPTRFPDCWVAYGATDAELNGYGHVVPLQATPRRTSVIGRAILVGAGAILAIAPLPELVRIAGILLCSATLVSAAVAAIRWWGNPSTIVLRRDGVQAMLAAGQPRLLPWDRIAEIGLVEGPRQRAVGLRLYGDERGDTGTAGVVDGLGRLLRGGFDLLIAPALGEHHLLSRVLLRYCIDPTARRRVLPD